MAERLTLTRDEIEALRRLRAHYEEEAGTVAGDPPAPVDPPKEDTRKHWML
jgi:hypothetical protein